VVAVPTDSTDEQKETLSKAFADAQIEVLQFIPEPIAAVLAYNARAEHDGKDKLIVVADLGGTRSDVAIVASRGGMYSVLAAAHDYMLGGAQLDQVLIDHFAKEFMKKHKTDPRSDPRSLAKLKLESEAVKKALSQSASATFSVESLADGIDFRATINRTRYELLAAKIFMSFRRLIEDAVRKAGLEVLDIDEVSGRSDHTRVQESDAAIGHSVRWYGAHTKNCSQSSIRLPREYGNPRACDVDNGNQSVRARGSRRGGPGIFGPRIR
jgi:molecular chaperone DnaK (HSP70)